MRIGVFIPELVRHLFKKPATVDYPFIKQELPPGFRGSPYLKPETCIVCRACERDCPAEAIEIISINEAEKRFKMIIHNDRCIHCAQCVDSCPTDAMNMDTKFEISDYDRHNLKMEWEYVRAVIKPKSAEPKS
ncbi:MAG: 4Fe-4S binding protein [Candidatus Aminicenantes bacterium]|nr:4Fe-4S binding protein [Candidatus Aminicenantes bacterium]